MSENRFTGARRRALAVVAGVGLVASALPAVSSAATQGSGSSPATSTTQYANGQYVVVLQDAPLATHPSTSPAQGDKLDVGSSAAQARDAQLLAGQDTVLADVSAEPMYRYTTVVNGFAVELTGAEAAALAQRPDVASVTADVAQELTSNGEGPTFVDSTPGPDTEVSPDLLGLRGEGGVWEQLGGADQAGAGVVVGVIDTGTDWTSPSFDPAAVSAPPEDFTGDCETGPGWPAEACNDKSVSGEFFIEGFDESGNVLAAGELRSPRDTDTHGSHVASTAAGNQVTVQDFDVSGMAPAAHVASYKTCWLAKGQPQYGCFSSDSIAAIDKAVADGVDVLNFSISGPTNTYEDPTDLAFKNATAAGVFVAASAGNSGPDAGTVAHIGPWMTTVGAATHRTDDQLPPGAPPGGPVPSIVSFSSRGPVDVAPAEQTILNPDVGAPGYFVLAAAVDEADESAYGYLSGTSMSSPHIAGLAALQIGNSPEWSPMAVKSSLLTSATDYANAESNDPFNGGTGFVTPPNMLTPGLVFDSTEADWDAFLADPSTGADLNQASVQIPVLVGGTADTVTRTVTNVSDEALTYTASTEGPVTMSVVVTPATATIPAGESAEVTITVANTGAPADEWQKTWLTWTAVGGAASDVRIPVIARGEVSDDEPAPTVDRVRGMEPDADRYGTAAEIARLYPDTVDTVYITTGEDYYDALAASPSAAQGLAPSVQNTPDGEPAPILLVESDNQEQPIKPITQEVLDEIAPSNVVILGGTRAVSQAVQDELEEQFGEEGVDRVGGATRYDTAAALAEEFGDVDTVYVATGETDGFGDALSGAALAGSENAPVLLTRKESVPQAVLDAYEILTPENVVVLGGTNAIDADTFDELGGTERLSGPTRYETSAAIVASFGYDAESGDDAPVAHVATGENFPDALAGAALAGFQQGPVVLTRNDTAEDQDNPVPAAVIEALDDISPDEVFILGGLTAVSQEAEDQLNEEYPAWAE